MDAIQALKLEAPKELQITNPVLIDGFTAKDFYLVTRYQESKAIFDPFKKRVV
jgi:hypothetical protein